jgi:hypothetical protein
LDDEIKTADGNASPAAYGWCFQVGAGISLMLDYVQVFSHIKMEGASDDIELTLDEGKKLYAQAKSVTQIGDQRSAGRNLKDALMVLLKDEKNGDAIKLVYITNIANPLLSKTVSAFQYDRIYDFSILPANDQKKIIDKVGEDFSTDKFQLQILYFFGEGNNKFVRIKEKIKEFLLEAIGDASFSNRLLTDWFEILMVNAADKPDNEKKISLSKKQIIFPVIAVIIDPPITDIEFARVCEYEDYAEITQDFRKTIYETTCDYEFIAQVLGDYLVKRKTAIDLANYKYEFTKNEWKNYEQGFMQINNENKRQALIKILILTIITRNEKINQIKKAVNL